MDIDTLFRGDFDKFIDSLDEALRQPWGALELDRDRGHRAGAARRQACVLPISPSRSSAMSP
jgi:hypothetical protein